MNGCVYYGIPIPKGIATLGQIIVYGLIPQRSQLGVCPTPIY
jgi:hypothetical protein